MDVSSKEAFSLLRKWQSEKTSLSIVGTLSEGLVQGFKGLVTISGTNESLGKIIISAEGNTSKELDVSGAVFSLTPNAADDSRSSMALIINPLEGGIVIFSTC